VNDGGRSRLQDSNRTGRRDARRRLVAGARSRLSSPPIAALDIPGRYVPPSEYFALWRTIRVVSGNPNIGIALATSVKPELTEPLFLAILSVVNLADAIGVVSRFKRLLEPEDLIVVDDDTLGQLAVTYDWPGCDETVPQALVSAKLAFLVEIGRRGTGHTDVLPREICLSVPELEVGSQNGEFFRCAIRPAASSNGIVFAAEDTQRPFVTHNPQLLTALLPYLQASRHHLGFSD